MSLTAYEKKRDFSRTAEPKGGGAPAGKQRFVIQEHHATSLHFDLRLEIDGVLKSWAVPKGPSLNPADRRLAMATEDHPLEYLTYGGTIPKGNYGAGEMRVWDSGDYELIEGTDPLVQWTKGALKVRLSGSKLCGGFMLVRSTRDPKAWFLSSRSVTNTPTRHGPCSGCCPTSTTKT